MVKANHHIIY